DFIPLGRAGESEDLARAIRFLAGPESGWVTGQIFAADGGQELRGFPDPNYSLDQIYGKDVMDSIRAGKIPEAAGQARLIRRPKRQPPRAIASLIWPSARLMASRRHSACVGGSVIGPEGNTSSSHLQALSAASDTRLRSSFCPERVARFRSPK